MPGVTGQYKFDISNEAWTPAQLANITTWFDPTRGLVNGTSWSNAINTGLALFTTNSGNTDMVAGNGINGAATVNVNLVGGLTYLYNTQPMPISTTAFTIGSVFNYFGSSPVNTQPYTNPCIIGDSANAYWGQTITATAAITYIYSGSSRWAGDNVPINSASGPHFVISTFNGSTIQTSIDGAPFNPGTFTGGNGIADAGEYGMFDGNAQTYMFKGYCGDVIVCNAVIGNNDFNRLVAWIKNRYRL